MRFAKGHGTGNDFVVLPDPDGSLELMPQAVALLCHRRFGIGGDGVLRVVRARRHPEGLPYAGQAEWFMDYRNSDGSLAQTCGNGIRVFARYLTATGLVDTARFPVATRAGLVRVEVSAESVSVDMDRPVVGTAGTALVGGRHFPGTAVRAGNPNLVCWIDDPSTVDLSVPPDLDPVAFPESANVEFIAPVTGGTPDPHVRMRVHERGSGETLSCGTGACAVAAVVLRDAGLTAATVTVDVPGGRLAVSIDQDRCILSGPAVIVATGETSLI